MGLLFLEHTEVTDQQPSYGNISKPAGKTSNDDDDVLIRIISVDGLTMGKQIWVK